MTETQNTSQTDMSEAKLTELRELRSKALETACKSCLQPGGILYPDHGHLCVDCAAKLNSYETAGKHLEHLLEPVFSAWWAHWQQQGLGVLAARDLVMQAGALYTERFDNLVKDERHKAILMGLDKLS
jgi:hypothetical protein